MDEVRQQRGEKTRQHLVPDKLNTMEFKALGQHLCDDPLLDALNFHKLSRDNMIVS